jgi:hypothetical protein
MHYQEVGLQKGLQIFDYVIEGDIFPFPQE